VAGCVAGTVIGKNAHRMVAKIEEDLSVDTCPLFNDWQNHSAGLSENGPPPQLQVITRQRLPNGMTVMQVETP